MDITHDNVCSSMLSCFYSHLLSTGRPISSCYLFSICFEFWCWNFEYLSSLKCTILYHSDCISLLLFKLYICRYSDVYLEYESCLESAQASNDIVSCATFSMYSLCYSIFGHYLMMLK